jgi:hypothetical protein
MGIRLPQASAVVQTGQEILLKEKKGRAKK